MGIIDYLGNLFGYVLEFFYNIFNNYAIAIFLFTIFTRILMFPLTISQQKSSAKMAKIQPKQKELMAKYGDNREKYNEELTKLYQKEGVNASAGCLPMLIQLPIVYGLFVAIRKPISLMLLHMPGNDIVAKLASNLGIDTAKNAYYEISLIGELSKKGIEAFDGLGFTEDQITRIMDVVNGKGFSLFGIDLLQIPEFFGNVAFIFTILVVLCQFGSMYISQKISGASMQSAGCNPMVLNVIMSLFIGYISMGIPCAMAFYWICTSLIAPIQSLIVHKFYNATILNARSDARHMVTLRDNEQKIVQAVNSAKGKREFLPNYNYVEEKKENKKGKKKK